MCGGTSSAGVDLSRSSGLSPRVRGNPTYMGAGSACAGSIPACAGEPRKPGGRRRSTEVYPRVCGGTDWIPPVALRGNGLSPRVRGNPLPDGSSLVGGRSIPACAGEPRWLRLPGRLVRVYPRVCGGTDRCRTQECSRRGLSPRVRGNRLPLPPQPGFPRSIPACAGEPRVFPVEYPSLEVYPRVCGGTSSSSMNMLLICGLSPRVRGNHTSAAP